MKEENIQQKENTILLWAFRAMSAALISLLIFIYITDKARLEAADRENARMISELITEEKEYDKKIMTINTNIFIICQKISVKCVNAFNGNGISVK